MFTKNSLVIISIMMIILLFSGCITENKYKTYNKTDYSFNYTASWYEYFDHANYGKILVIGEAPDLSKTDKTGFPIVRVVIIKLNNETPPNGFNNACEILSNQLNLTGFNRTNSQFINIDGKTAYEINGISSYQKLDGTNVTTNERILIINDLTGLYMIQCIAPNDKFKENEENFDIIIKTFHVNKHLK